MVITTFIDLIQTIVVYRLACMKKSGNRLLRCSNFVIHHKVEIFRHGHSSGYGLIGTITTSLGGGLEITIKAARQEGIFVLTN